MLKLKNIDLIFATFHVDVGETPFFISIDHDKKVIVISIRGTLSMKVKPFKSIQKYVITLHLLKVSYSNQFCIAGHTDRPECRV